jgi:hypothetical protein
MFSRANPKRLASTVAASLLFGVAFASHAETVGSPSYARASTTMPSNSCDSARLSAWFERQRQLTDGNTDPFARITTPAECGASKMADREADGRPDSVAKGQSLQRTQAAAPSDPGGA